MKSSYKLVQKLKSGKCVVGTWCEIPSPEVVNVIAKSGLDFIIIDMEHGAMGFVDAAHMILSAEAEGCCAFIRVPGNNESDILRALELAPAGIIVPHIESVVDRALVVKSAKFPPIGNRSLNPYTRAGGYKMAENLMQQQNKETIISLIIESREALLNVTDIIDDKSVDIVYIGIYDLSVALGAEGNIQSAPVIDSLKKLVKISRDKKKVVGSMFHSVKEFDLLKKLGVQFLCYKVDTAVIFDEFRKIVEASKLK